MLGLSRQGVNEEDGTGALSENILAMRIHRHIEASKARHPEGNLHRDFAVPVADDPLVGAVGSDEVPCTGRIG